MNKEIKEEFEGLARMIKSGFDGVDKRFEYMENRFDKRFAILERGQEDIKLRLGEKANHFEAKELNRRMDVLERKVGLAGVK